jgi:hypothetical protein
VRAQQVAPGDELVEVAPDVVLVVQLDVVAGRAPTLSSTSAGRSSMT